MTADLQSITTRNTMGHVKGLLASLVPRAKSFFFYDLERSAAWNSENSVDYELDSFMAELPDEVV